MPRAHEDCLHATPDIVKRTIKISTFHLLRRASSTNAVHNGCVHNSSGESSGDAGAQLDQNETLMAIHCYIHWLY